MSFARLLSFLDLVLMVESGLELAKNRKRADRSQWRTVEVTEQRTAIDYAHLLQKLVDCYYPEAWMITVVQDNLNTHTPASLYKAFEPAEARRIINRLDFCYTPKHGSWLIDGRNRIKCSISTMP